MSMLRPRTLARESRIKLELSGHRTAPVTPVSDKLRNLYDSVRLESAPFTTEMQAFNAFLAQSKQPGFVFGFVDSESKVVVSFYQRLPEPKS